MRFNKRVCSVIVLTMFVIQLLSPLAAFASEQALKPLDVDVAKDGQGNYKIYDDSDVPFKHRVSLTWSDVGFPGDADIISNGYRIYTREEGKTQWSPYPVTVDSGPNPREIVIDANGEEKLNSGTIYSARVTAFHTHQDDNDAQETHESSILTATNINFLTDIQLTVKTAGTDSIEIKWDDVKLNNNRISYELYIKESKDFGNIPTFTVRPEDVSSAGPVVPILAERKLSYTAKGLRGGTIYYIKIKPIISSTIRHNPETVTVIGATNIIATATRLSDDWWRLEWNRITNANLGQGEQIHYLIKRGDTSAPDQLPVTLGSTTDNKYYVQVSKPEYFFYITTTVSNQLSVQPTTLESERLKGVEEDVPAKPPMPEIHDVILENPGDEDTAVYEYVYAVSSTEAKIAWTPPTKADGSEDTDVVYDIWLLTDADDLSNPNAVKLRDSYTIPTSGMIFGEIDKEQLLGYSYTFNNLTPNTVYYLKIIAKKMYTINVDGQLIQKYYESEPALKVIVTPTGGPINQPEAPAKPPLRVKLTTDGKPDVGTSSINIQWENRWWEEFRNGEWVYYPEDSFESVTGSVYRHVIYDSDVRFDIGYIEYPEGEDAIDFDQIVRNNPTRINGIPNNMLSIVQNYTITNLVPNTKYIIWLKAHRVTGDLISEPSDPLTVITRPDVPTPIERPVVPTFTYSKGGDTYVDLEWTAKEGYYYYIKYNTVDDIGSAQNAPEVTPEDLQISSVYRINGLKPNQVYYFWIQADSTQSKADQNLSTSLWSDSIYTKTTPYLAPETPKGFGIKDGEGSTTKNSITFEWIKEAGLTYVLEISTDVNYKNGTEYKDISAEEYTATGLRSNLRYWARLYAYDPVKGLRSDPTQSITVVTKRSDDDYDSDVDTDNVITGPFIEDDYSGGVWTLKIVGVNADRFVEKVQTDKILDYRVDFKNEHSGARKRVLLVSNKVFTALSALRENINIDSGFSLYTIRPHVIDSEQVNQISTKYETVNIELTITQSGTSYGTGDSTLNFEYPASNLEVNIVTGTQVMPLESFNNPIRVGFPYTNETLFADGRVNGYIYDDENIKWSKQATASKYDNLLKSGYATMDMKAPGSAALLKKSQYASHFYDIGGHAAESAINSIYSKFELPSISKGYFKPYDTITIGDASKLVMDILGYKYGADFADTAAKAGFITAADIKNTNKGCTRKQLAKMLDRMYEIKVGEKAPEVYGGTTSNQLVTRGDALQELYYRLYDLGEI